jgi:uncharacterized protein with GYD domain
MPRYLVRFDFAPEYLDGVLRVGFGARERYSRGLVERHAGTLEATYWAHGEHDLYMLIDMPDATSANALLLGAARSGLYRTTTTSVFTSAEMDEAAKTVAEVGRPDE